MPTILLVEDEALLHEGVQEILEASGYAVVCAADGQEAIACLAQEPASVSLVISDLVMPNMNGIDLLEKVKNQFPHLPIILASGSSNAVMRRLGMDSIHVPEATASIMKPFNAAELLALVERVLLETQP